MRRLLTPDMPLCRLAEQVHSPFNAADPSSPRGAASHAQHSVCLLRPGAVVLLVDAKWFRLARLRLRRRFRACVYVVMYCLHWCMPPDYVLLREDYTLGGPSSSTPSSTAVTPVVRMARTSSFTRQRRGSSVMDILGGGDLTGGDSDSEKTPLAGKAAVGFGPTDRREIVSVASESMAAWKLIQHLSKVRRWLPWRRVL